jgi:purine-binding chemotaxis protein CheW
MSMQTPYLTFLLQGGWYAVEASHVREILRLPGLTPVSEAPHYIIGVMNYRGHIVPVMDLAIRLGQSPWSYRIHDHVIVLQHESALLGIIVNEVQGVHEIPIDTRGTHVPFAGSHAGRSRFVRHLAKLDTTAIMVVDHDLLLNPVAEFQTDANPAAPTLPLANWQQSPEHAPPADGTGPNSVEAMPLFFQHAAPWEREVLLERARSLASNLDERSARQYISLAIVGLGGEYFAVELTTVREFTDLQRITPVPCCPSSIVGDMNLRGDILTVVDIRQVLQMPVGEAVPTAKVMVVPLGDALVGVLVDEVFDVFDLDPAALTAVPSASKSINDTCLKGTVSYYGKMVAILDLQKILTTGGLTVDEED